MAESSKAPRWKREVGFTPAGERSSLSPLELPLHVTGIVFSLIFVVKRLMLRERTGSLMPENQSDTI
jgi:hypothetical protein